MCWMNEWINIQWIFHCLQMPRKWALVKIVMYSCRCRILHNCRRYTAPYVWHIQCTPYTAMCSNHGVLGPLGDGNWKAQIPKKVQRPQLQVPRSFPPGHIHWQDSASLFVLTFLSVSSCVSSLHHSDTLILVIALSCSRLSSAPPAHIFCQPHAFWFLSPTASSSPHSQFRFPRGKIFSASVFLFGWNLHAPPAHWLPSSQWLGHRHWVVSSAQSPAPLRGKVYSTERASPWERSTGGVVSPSFNQGAYHWLDLHFSSLRRARKRPCDGRQ